MMQIGVDIDDNKDIPSRKRLKFKLSGMYLESCPYGQSFL